MGKNSTIEWTHHTFNPWWGCYKISPACENCYAEKWAKRTGNANWGPDSERRFFTESHWSEPLKWDKDASKNKERKRVFCASMADIFEDREDLNKWRAKIWYIIHETPNLDWLLLTKRPANIKRLVPWNDNWPKNVWLGTSVENQQTAEERIPSLLENRAKLHFISCEPLLGELRIQHWLKPSKIKWVIVGGESGPQARPTRPGWVQSLREQCLKAKVPFFFKQWGCWRPIQNRDAGKQKKFEFENETMVKMGKKEAGRELDGRIWDQVP